VASVEAQFLVTTGDVLNCSADVVCIPTNQFGIMGAGLALAAKQHFKGLEEAYRQACRLGLHSPSQPFVWTGDGPTAKGLADWLKVQTRRRRVAVPALGCGLGGLRFNDVLPILERHLRGLRHDVLVMLP
jgi:O-acetyl-ADP-ribose deacetylase (regulator of RNase III)